MLLVGHVLATWPDVLRRPPVRFLWGGSPQREHVPLGYVPPGLGLWRHGLEHDLRSAGGFRERRAHLYPGFLPHGCGLHCGSWRDLFPHDLDLLLCSQRSELCVLDAERMPHPG